MPNREPVVLAGEPVSVRLIGPQGAVFPSALMAPITFLGRTDFVAKPLLSAALPSSDDLVSASYTTRLGDSGECTLVFPNGKASDGIPWRQRFDPTGHLQWVEVYLGGVLESVCVVDQVTPDIGQVQVHGDDGWWVLKKAYERDWICVQAPRDVIERGTQLWVPVTVDNFPASDDLGQWNLTQLAGGTVAIGNSGGCVLSVPSTTGTAGNTAAGPGTAAQTASGGTVQWSNPNAIKKSDGNPAEIVSPGGSPTTYLLNATNFGFNVPAGATINGIRAKILRFGIPGVQVTDATVQLLKAGSPVGSNKASGTAWPSPEAYATYGSSSDLWGTTWSVSDVNGSGFGVGIAAQLPGQVGLVGGVDFVQITVYYTAGAGSQPVAEIATNVLPVDATGIWRATTTLSVANLNGFEGLELSIVESSGDQYSIVFFGSSTLILLQVNGTTITRLNPTSAASYTLMLESDGAFVWAYVNGALLGTARRGHGTTTSLTTAILLQATQSGQSATATITGVLCEAMQPFLMAGSDKGDYVLPGTASTYPSGGIHARYYNDMDLQSDTNRLLKILAPDRSQAYGGSGAPEYANKQDAGIAGGDAPIGVAPATGPPYQNWSVRKFGAVYLKLSAGNYTMSLSTPSGGNSAVRLWIGKTGRGMQLVDQWAWQNGGTFTFTVSSAAVTGLAGYLPYGAGTQARDGWYPIIMDYAVDGTALSSPTLKITNSPAAYTDPGGTSISSGSQSTTVPFTSFSPLGCVDQRYQGISHYDLAQQTVQAYGHQASVEPYQLETLNQASPLGQFPGQLAPRVREGHDSDLILQPDTGPRQDAEGMLNYSSTLDTTDSAYSIMGNGAGFQNGTTGQLQAQVYDAPSLQNALFDIQAWNDFSDASFPSLLQGLLNTSLGLRLTPWQLLSADPNGLPRPSFTWPLSGALAAMRWRPGDGIRINAREINVWDTVPRQLLVVTRNLLPQGIASTTASFANRPRTAALSVRQQIRAATRPQRNYQRQLVTLTGTAVVNQTITTGATGPLSLVAPLGTDTIVRSYLRVTSNSSGVSFNVKVNNVDQTGALNGPWTVVPGAISLVPVAGPDVNGQLYAAVVNNSVTSSSSFTYVLLADVLR